MTNLEMHEMKLEMLQYMSKLAEAQEQLEAKLQHLDLIVGEVDTGAKSRYKYLLGEMQLEDGKLEQRLDKVQNAVGYCLRKVREAVETDPQSAYLRQILDAVEDLAYKFN